MESLVAQLASGRQLKTAIEQLAYIFDEVSDDERVATNNTFVRSIMSTNGATEQLAAFLASNDVDTKNRAMLLFATLCETASEFRAEVASGHLDTVITALINGATPGSTQSKDEVLTRKLSLRALGTLVQNAKAAQAAAAAGAFDMLVRLIQPAVSTMQDEEITDRAVVALAQMLQASLNRCRQAISSGAIEAMASLALSSAHYNAVSCLSVLLGALSPAQMTTYKQHVKLAIAALANLVVRSTVPGTEGADVQQAAAKALFYLQSAARTQSVAEILQWVVLDISTALARARAGPVLLKMASSESIMLLYTMTTFVSEQNLLLARTAGSIDRLNQLMKSSEPALRAAAAGIITNIKADSPEGARLVGSSCDAERVVAAVPVRSNVRSCARCGAVDGEGGVKLSECSACSRVAYCGKACQKAHWKVHKPDCVPRG